MATSGAEAIPRTRKSLASQDKVTLPLGKEPVFSLCSGDLEMLVLLGTWRCSRTPPPHEGRSRRKQRFPPSLWDLTYSPLQWFLLGSDVFTCFQVPPTEQGLRKSIQLAANYPRGYKIWYGPITPKIVFCHPDMIRSITNASGTHA